MADANVSQRETPLMVGFSTAPTVLASFAASLVEFVEALTVVLAVGAVRGWRWALIGTGAAVAVLAVLVVTFGQSISRIPLPIVQFIVGTLLLMFGLRWLRKAILRYAGAIALHDEAAAFTQETASLRAAESNPGGGWDKVAFASAFKIVMLEGVEVVFIVIAMGASGRLLLPASVGAAAALGVVVCLGVALHRPLANLPENALKFCVGILLTAFGTFWVGEGIHVEWPGGDWSLWVLFAVYFVVAQALVHFCRSRVPHSGRRTKKAGTTGSKSPLRALSQEVFSLFVDDGALAAGILVWAAAAGWSAGRLPLDSLVQCGLFVLGFAMLLAYSAARAVRG